MSEADARTYAARLREREVGRGGAEHARSYLETFASGLRGGR